jgi:hypothetical protein
MAKFIRSDLEFILEQILIAEEHAAGADLRSLLPNVQVPFGLRTVDGSFNNLVFNRGEFGAADNIFPRLLDPVFRPAENVTFDPDGPGGQAVGSPTSYAQTSGAVFDSTPRTISNLIVDMTDHNPAAVAAAGGGNEGARMKVQRVHVEEEIASLRAQIAQAKSSLVLQEKFYEANQGLLKGGFISPTRLQQMEATVADYAAKLEEQRSALSRAVQRLVDSDLKINSVQNEYAKAASDQVKATAARLGEIEQEMRKSEDAALRQVVLAPASGEVIDLKFTSPGAVVRPGEPIAEIVPSEAQLLIEARIRPEDVSHVYLDQNAKVKFTAFRYRSTSMATGKVTYVSGDRLIDRANNFPYYSVIILVDADSLRTAGGLKVTAGMPAEVYIEGTKQTPLQYITEPITSTVRKAGRQI